MSHLTLDIVKSTGKQATNTLNSTTKTANGVLGSTTGNVQKTAGKVANAPLKGVNPPKKEHGNGQFAPKDAVNGIGGLAQGIRV